MRKLVAALTLSALSLPGAALAFRAFNGAEVAVIAEGVFEVTDRGGSAAQAFWCGAGDFVTATGGASNQRIYIAKGLGPSTISPGRKAVQFSLTPPPGVDTTPGFSLSVRRVGDNMRTASARQYCYDRLLEPF